jgi:hypothetical protein
MMGENRVRLSTLKGTGTSAEAENVYTFYAGMVNGFELADLLKFILHTALSVFIAFMAPTGIKMLGIDVSKTLPNANTEAPTNANGELDLTTWIRFMWRGMRLGKIHIPSEELMKEYCYIHGIDWNQERHQEYSETARRLGLITAENKLAISEPYARKKLEKA